MEHIYFIGIGGIGMSALALYFHSKRKEVRGYDRTPSDITHSLEEKGIAITFTEDLDFIPKHYTPENTLVVYTPAIPKEHRQLVYFQEHQYKVCKRSEVLGLITQESFCLAVAGTHGKTTTSSLLAHLLVENNAPVSAFLGGICENFQSNFICKGTEITVVEADEFDRSFLRLSPTIACITAVDADHLDIYGDEKEFLKGFEDFTHRIKEGGKLIVRKGIPFEGLTYGLESGCDYQITKVRIENGGYLFDIEYTNPKNGEKEIAPNCRLYKPGEHHLLNALAAVAVAHQAGFDLIDLGKALSTFKGVKRRFSYIINTEKQVFIDDYAHHPTELNALYNGVRTMHPNEEITILFQPHLFTRTRDFAEGFAKSLSQFDRVILLDIYPARELPIEGITSEWLLSQIENPNKILIEKSRITDYLRENPAPVLVLTGAGDIGVEVETIKNFLEK